MRSLPRLAIVSTLLVAATALAKPLVPTAPPVPFEKGDLWGYKNRGGKVVIEPRFRLAEAYVAGGHLAPVVDGEGFAWIDRRGEVVARPFVFDNGADEFAGGFTRILDRTKRFGFMDATGHVAIPPQFTYAGRFSDDRASFCEGCRAVKEKNGEHTFLEGGKWGFIDKQGTIVIAATYDEVVDFHQGRARVRQNSTWSTIDRSGKPVAEKTKN